MLDLLYLVNEEPSHEEGANAHEDKSELGVKSGVDWGCVGYVLKILGGKLTIVKRFWVVQRLFYYRGHS